MGKKVYIGVGHGGYDPGAVGNGLKEKDLNLSIAMVCQAELVRHGVTVMMSRTTDISESTSAKAAECNRFDPDLCADIHINAGGGDGAEVWCSINGGTGRKLAANILEEIKAIGQNSRGIKTRKNSAGKDYFGFIRLTNAPANIVECAFIDTKKDIAIIDTAAEQKVMGIAIAKGFLRTLGIEWKSETPAVEKETEVGIGGLFYVQAGAFAKKENAEAFAQELLEKGYPCVIKRG